MGPHSFECGIALVAAPALAQTSGRFNGAALIRVRNRLMRLLLSLGARRFNGAALIRVRNMRNRHSLADEPRRFNGAALIRVRNRNSGLSWAGGRPASMGPHSFECGIGTGRLHGARGLVRFNGAALIRVRNMGDTSVGVMQDRVLQWGRTHSSAEYCRPPI